MLLAIDGNHRIVGANRSGARPSCSMIAGDGRHGEPQYANDNHKRGRCCRLRFSRLIGTLFSIGKVF
jgi:hypothetical protein